MIAVVAEGSNRALPLVASEGTLLRFRRCRPGPFEPSTSDVDLSKFWLPQTPFTLGPTSMAEHTSIIDTIHAAAALASGRMRITKTTHTVLASLVSVYAKVFEFAWLNGCFTLSALTRAHTDELAKELAAGGWYRALRLEERTKTYLEGASAQEVRSLLQTHSQVLHLVPADVVRLIGTTASRRELGLSKGMLAEAAGYGSLPHRHRPLRRPAVAVSGMSGSALVQTLNVINTLFDLPEGDRLSFVPFPETGKVGLALGKAARRTPDIGPEDVAALLTVSFDRVNRTSEPIIAFCEAYLKRLGLYESKRAKVTWPVRLRIFRECMGQSSLEAQVGARITGINKEKGDEGLTLYALLEDLFSASFIIIGLLNARRKDEISGKGIGLRSDSLRLVDAELNLYECEFFIEKTHQCRVPFFVGDATVKTMHTLRRLSELALRYQEAIGHTAFDPHTVYSIFQMPVTGRLGRPQAFEFSARPGKTAERLIREALGDKDVDIAAHVFRRAYSLLFHYRYENSDLLALSQQLCHFDVTATRTYVTDAQGGTSPGKAFRRLTPEQRRALAEEAHDLDEHLSQVSAERLELLSREVIEGRARYSGGFARLVQRFHQRNLSRIEYRKLPTADKAARLSKALMARGHRFEPMPHGNCVAREAGRNPSAGCYSREAGRIDRARASPRTCATCPYHLASQQHLHQLEIRADELREELAASGPATVMNARTHKELNSLRKAIEIHRCRLAAIAA
jgi:hypothetical protein